MSDIVLRDYKLMEAYTAYTGSLLDLQKAFPDKLVSLYDAKCVPSDIKGIYTFEMKIRPALDVVDAARKNLDIVIENFVFIFNMWLTGKKFKIAGMLMMTTRVQKFRESVDIACMDSTKTNELFELHDKFINSINSCVVTLPLKKRPRTPGPSENPTPHKKQC